MRLVFFTGSTNFVLFFEAELELSALWEFPNLELELKSSKLEFGSRSKARPFSSERSTSTEAS